MRLPSFCGLRGSDHVLHPHLMAWVVIALVVQSWLPAAFAAADDSDESPSQSSNESQKKDSKKDFEKFESKYAIDRLGQREIGHGFNLYSLKREHELGQSMAASFAHYAKFVTDPVVNEYIDRIGQKLVRNSDANVPFTIRVIDFGDIPRAYGLPGGFLYVDSALILAADDEAELAAVMAHEIAHVAARHATRALTRKQVCNIVTSLTLFAGPAGVALENTGGLAGPLSVKKFSRDSEYEADLLGIEYAYASGYDPEALLSALEKLHAIEQRRSAAAANIPGYHLASKVPFHTKLARSFSSYPLTQERIERLQAEISTYLPDRKDYVLSTGEFEEVKARLLASRVPTLHHHSDGDEKGPVLRRSQDDTPDIDITQNEPQKPEHLSQTGAFAGNANTISPR
ncbi:MAG TPA: M48 family metalloprotease [Candidatus Solibacter sp.]|nr:M48 family metalloprotease [Candidatus Solibacter sp.]